MNWLERIFRRRHLYSELGEGVREHIEEKTGSSCASGTLPVPRHAMRPFARSAIRSLSRRGVARSGNGPGSNPSLPT
jgi:hypothetical protein